MARRCRSLAHPALRTHVARAELIAAALAGDQLAWEELTQVTRCIVFKVLGTFDVCAIDRDEVLGATLETVFLKLSAVREPDAVLGWISVVARNHTLRMLRRQREVPSDAGLVEACLMDDDFADAVDVDFLPAWRRTLTAIDALKPFEQELLRLLLREPDLSYAEVARRLRRPVGSIGPTRQRTLAKLRAAMPVNAAA